MKELLRTNDAVLLSFVAHALEENGIDSMVLDTHMSILDGSIGVLPRRLMVADDDLIRAERILDVARNTDLTAKGVSGENSEGSP